MTPFFNAILATLGAFLAGLLILAVKWLFTIKKNIGTMVENGKNRAEESRVQMKMLISHGKAIRATLEVVAKNNNNGNVDKAFEEMDEADEQLEDLLDRRMREREIVEVKK